MQKFKIYRRRPITPESTQNLSSQTALMFFAKNLLDYRPCLGTYVSNKIFEKKVLPFPTGQNLILADFENFQVRPEEGIFEFSRKHRPHLIHLFSGF